MRIFPHKLCPEDAEPETRRKVGLKAYVLPRVAGKTVYFKVWDVDDPFDQNNPNMPDVGIIDADASGPDNRGTDPAPGNYSGTTGDDGKARVTITVSMQPGNNYRAGASTDGSALGSTTRPQADANPPPPHVLFSDMLTVWRKLWVERDTMAAPDPADLRAVGDVDVFFPTPERPGLSTVWPWSLVNFNADLNNYEEGSVVFSNCPSGSDTFPVVESYPEDPFMEIPPEIVILGTPGACAAVGSGFTLRDDDDLTALGTPSTPRFPSGGDLLVSAFKPAYILPVYAGVEYQDLVGFDEYLTATEIDYGIGDWNDARDLWSSTQFWACLLIGAWEGNAELELQRNGDADPDQCFTLFPPQQAREGAEPPTTGASNVGGGMAVIFLQALADELVCVGDTDEPHTVLHEIGHGVGLEHRDWTIMHEGAPRNQQSFDSTQLDFLRSRTVW